MNEILLASLIGFGHVVGGPDSLNEFALAVAFTPL
jgi:hypothetical protein